MNLTSTKHVRVTWRRREAHRLTVTQERNGRHVCHVGVVLT
jgi:hypothetical protein